ncbi:TetR family transcriptional regulator [Azospirillum sp. CT11-132]|uniref:TetR family transcriptional regulator n=1 Tax=Azospirillum sp. CT11-132 TaxID=3396317 RepID=UPI0039A78352
MAATASSPRQRAVPRTDSRDRLLEATSQLLVERDTLDVSLLDIAARAELNHGLVGYYFGSKDGLLLALLKRDAFKALESLKLLVEADMPPIRKLQLHIAGIIKTYFRHPYINPLINRLQGSGTDSARELSEFFIKPLIALQGQILSQAEAAGQIRAIDPMLFYYSTIGAADFLFRSRGTLPFAFGIDAIDQDLAESYARHVVSTILHGVCK